MKRSATLLLFTFLAMILSKAGLAHCEVPCGIYHDELRVELIKEHIQTIEKAMNQISSLQEEDDENYNQIIRWVNTKDDHANLIQEIASQYFLHQRVKAASPDDEEKYAKYIAQLTSLHQLTVSAMKSKQGLDLAHTEDMRKALQSFEDAYFGEHRHNKDGSHK